MIRHSGTLSLFGIEMSAVVLPRAIFWEAVGERSVRDWTRLIVSADQRSSIKMVITVV